MSNQVSIVHEPFKDDKHRVAIVYKDGKQQVQVLIARGTNAVGETLWDAPKTPEEYQSVIEAWARKAYKDHDEEMARRYPRGGPDDR
ncbi:MAG TPA: hypothetical protein V6D08_12135 [Candidatus Obscuribacterales bacterium]